MKSNALKRSVLVVATKGGYAKRLVLFVVMLVVLESCSIYSKTSVTAAEAHDKGKVKIVDFTNKRFIFDNVELKDSIYYGIKNNQALRLYQEQPMSFYLKDQKASKRATLITVLVSTLITANVILVIEWSQDAFGGF